jgi:hypothetical protein
MEDSTIEWHLWLNVFGGTLGDMTDTTIEISI